MSLNEFFLRSLRSNQLDFVRLCLDHHFSLDDLFPSSHHLAKLYRHRHRRHHHRVDVDPLRCIYADLVQPLLGSFFHLDPLLPSGQIDVNKELFVWSLLNGRYQSALLFWTRMNNQICSSLSLEDE